MSDKLNSNQNETQTKEKQKWTTLHVPREVLNLLEKIKAHSKRDKANWKIVVEALSYYSSLLSNPKELMSTERTDKVAWYIMKVVMTFGKFLDEPTEQNYNLLMQRLNEIKQRLNANTEVVEKLVEQYIKTKKEDERIKTRVSLVQAMKMLIVMMMTEACTSEKEES